MDSLTNASRPLCVDLDGTLLRTDLLYESLLRLMAKRPWLLLWLPFWWLRGKAHLKRRIAERVSLDPALLPYDARVVDLLHTTAARPRVLCTASDSLLVQPIVGHLGVFDEVMCSDGSLNLVGACKADALVARFGERGFDYAGNSRVDLHVWARAGAALVVNGSPGLAAAAASRTNVVAIWPDQGAGHLRRWLKALRLHQWLKNLLVFVPLLASHRFLDPGTWPLVLSAFLAFGLCASSVYVLNDLLDLDADRRHPRKSTRPFAAGSIPLLHGLLAAPLLLAAAVVLAWQVGPAFLAVLGVYYTSTVAYSFLLKRLVMIDVILLAGLYTVRIVAGAAAIGESLSFWLLAFSMFVFLSLAMLKRYTELASILLAEGGGKRASGRGYTVDDLPLLQSLGGASGYLSVLVLALYINSPESLQLYERPQILWLLCPFVLYWMSRVWVVAHRGGMHDDPVVFAVKDRVSLAVAAACAVIIALAI